MAKSFWQRGEDYAKKVSSEIIDQIKRGVAPWQKPWKPGEQISAENFSTGQKYSGGNSLYLMSRAIRDGRGDNRWGTYNQIREAGGQRWTPSVGPLGGISKVDSAVVVAASKGNSERGRA